MTLLEAKQTAHNGEYITRAPWITETQTKLLVRQGGYSKPKDELYGGVLKTVAEYFKADGVTIEPHLDMLIIDDESPNVTCICGYEFAEEDIWADDYTVVRLEQGLDLAELPKEQADAIATKLDELVLKGEAIAVELSTEISGEFTLDPGSKVTIEAPQDKGMDVKLETTAAKPKAKKTTSNEEQPKDVQ